IREEINAFREMTNNNKQFIQEINQSLVVMKQTFTKRDQQLDSNVTMVKETLMNYVQSLEGTLGHKLEQLIRQLDQQSYQTNDQMNRSEEHTSELQSRFDLVCRLLLEKKKDVRAHIYLRLIT